MQKKSWITVDLTDCLCGKFSSKFAPFSPLQISRLKYLEAASSHWKQSLLHMRKIKMLTFFIQSKLQVSRSVLMIDSYESKFIYMIHIFFDFFHLCL